MANNRVNMPKLAKRLSNKKMRRRVKDAIRTGEETMPLRCVRTCYDEIQYLAYDVEKLKRKAMWR